MNHRLACGALLCCVLPVAQAVAPAYPMGRDAFTIAGHPGGAEALQRRKADLRATLQSQQVGQGGQVVRQWTQSDRAALRQQLRQQRLEESKP